VEILSNTNVAAFNSTEALSEQIGIQPGQVSVPPSSQEAGSAQLGRLSSFANGTSLGVSNSWSAHDFARAAIDAVFGFVNSLTVIWEAPKPPMQVAQPPAEPQPNPQPGQPAATPQPPADTPSPQPPSMSPPATTTPAPDDGAVIGADPGASTPVSESPRSLITTAARMFEFTNKSDWHPGGASQRAYVDLRSELKGRVSSIRVLSADGTTVLATGKLEKIISDGRPRFRFDKSGANLPPGAIILAHLTNGDGDRYIELDKPTRAFKW
jgi:hypothetical protein